MHGAAAETEHAVRGLNMLCAGLPTPHTLRPEVSRNRGDLRSAVPARSGDLRSAPGDLHEPHVNGPPVCYTGD